MNTSAHHQTAFELLHAGLDRLMRTGAAALTGRALREQILNNLEPDRQALLRTHWERCDECRADLALTAGLRAEARERWPQYVGPRLSSKALVEQVSAPRPVLNAGLLWQAGLLVVVMLALNWVIGNLRPQPAELTQAAATSTIGAVVNVTPTADARLAGVQMGMLEPFAQGRDVDPGEWSPDGRYLTFGQRAPASSGSDRIYTTFSVFDRQTGDICAVAEPWLGNFFPMNELIWLPDGQLLVLAGDEIQLTRPCAGNLENLTNLFGEVVEASYPIRNGKARLVLAGESAFWIYDHETGAVTKLTEPQPRGSDNDRVFWSPSGQVIAISQTEAGGSAATITFVEPESGLVTDSLTVATSGSVSVTWMDWVLEDVMYVFRSAGIGGTVVERAARGGWSQTEINAASFGLSEGQADQIQATGAVAAADGEHYRLLVVLITGAGYQLNVLSSETGSVETYPLAPDTLLLLNNRASLPLYFQNYAEVMGDTWKLFDLEAPEVNRQPVAVGGHFGRNYEQLQLAWLPGRQQVLFGSSQGISLVDIESGNLHGYWQLGGVEAPLGYVSSTPTPNEEGALIYAIIEAGLEGLHSALYYLPLE